jgi:hypothetical protein
MRAEPPARTNFEPDQNGGPSRFKCSVRVTAGRSLVYLLSHGLNDPHLVNNLTIMP